MAGKLIVVMGITGKQVGSKDIKDSSTLRLKLILSRVVLSRIPFFKLDGRFADYPGTPPSQTPRNWSREASRW